MSRNHICILFALLNGVLLPTEATAGCNADNCLRALSGSPSSASAFCLTYTVAPAPSIPAFASPCSSSAARLSSACECFGASVKTTSSSSTQSSSPTSSSSPTTSPTTCPAVLTVAVSSISIVSPTACPSVLTSISTISQPSPTVTITAVSIAKPPKAGSILNSFA
jgi:hypothetical protein